MDYDDIRRLVSAFFRFPVGMLFLLKGIAFRLEGVQGADSGIFFRDLTEFVREWRVANRYYLGLYGATLSKMISEGKYDLVNLQTVAINEENFPRVKSGKSTVQSELLKFGLHISSKKKALSEMDKKGLRPATLEELLSFGTSNPEVQREFRVIALGAPYCAGGYSTFVCLDRDHHLRVLGLHFGAVDWNGRNRFLAVRK